VIGVLVTKDLSPSVHVNDALSRAMHKRAGAILRTFVSRDVNLLMRAFIAYVRPIVEYNNITGTTSVVWSPSTTVRDIEVVERVQRRFNNVCLVLDTCLMTND